MQKLVGETIQSALKDKIKIMSSRHVKKSDRVNSAQSYNPLLVFQVFSDVHLLEQQQLVFREPNQQCGSEMTRQRTTYFHLKQVGSSSTRYNTFRVSQSCAVK